MHATRITLQFIIGYLLINASCFAATLNAGPYVYGAAGSERGDIIRSLPGAKPSYRLRCEQRQCERYIQGYIYRRNDALETTLRRHLSRTARAQSELLKVATRSASLSIAADGASTAAGLAAGATERNPLLGNSPQPLSLLAWVLLRQGLAADHRNNQQLTFAQKTQALCAHAGFAMGATANNLAVLVTGGGPIPIIMGWLVGQAQHASCLAQVEQAQKRIETLENQGLRAYATMLQTAQVSATSTAL